jgi:nucleotide-binding universal stress UspA family protein
MYQRILVPLDGSPVAEAILAHALNLSQKENAELFLLNIAVDPAAAFSFSEPGFAEEFVENQENTSKEYLSEICANLIAKGYKVSSVIRTGPVPATILDVAAEINADIIAMSTHARRGVAHLFLGSVAEKVLRTASIPVLLFRPPAE